MALIQDPVMIALQGGTQLPAVRRVLIADDDRLTRQKIAESIRKWGYEVTEVDNGALALAQLSGQNAPDIAILDWEMPGLSGPEICRIIRARPGRYTYLILLTSKSDPQSSVMGLNAGADDFLAKPPALAELQVRLGTGRRIIELQAELLDAQKELERRAMYDQLTDIRNRATIIHVLETELTRAKRTNGSLSVIMFDVDHFKSVNDNWGHRCGDVVLREIAQRAADAVRPYDMLGRYGGEEFVAVVPDCNIIEATRVAERMRAVIRSRAVPYKDTAIPISASFGVASVEQGFLFAPRLLEAADRALYLAKSKGRDRVESYEADSAGSVSSRAAANMGYQYTERADG